MDLDSMRYSDLRRLAKEAGLKANMKADKLQKALKQYYDKQKKTENGNDVGTVDVHVESAGDQVQLNVANNAAFVTKRRGRGQRVKRKHPADGDTGNDSDLMQPASPKQGVVKFAEVEEEGNRNSKRRKVSLAKDDEPEPKAIQKTFNPCHDDAVMNTVEGKNMVKPGKIPRHEGLMKKNKNTIRPTTPNFRKLHEAHFNKMESIDSYVQRKNKQMEVFRNSVKELKSLSEKTILKPLDKKDSASKAKVSRASLFSPQVQERGTSSDRRRRTQASAGQSALKDSTAFKPTVLTTNKINVKFSRSIQDDDNKRCLVKTPAHTSPLVIVTSTPGRKSAVRGKPEGNKSTGLTNKTPGLTPFVFNGDTSASSTPCTTKKNTFNLKASLSRPLTYKPHKGKLKPFGATQENATLNKSQNIPSHQKNYKQHQVQTREERRTKQTEGRKQKKENMLGARRGLVMA